MNVSVTKPLYGHVTLYKVMRKVFALSAGGVLPGGVQVREIAVTARTFMNI